MARTHEQASATTAILSSATPRLAATTMDSGDRYHEIDDRLGWRDRKAMLAAGILALLGAVVEADRATVTEGPNESAYWLARAGRLVVADVSSGGAPSGYSPTSSGRLRTSRAMAGVRPRWTLSHILSSPSFGPNPP